MVWLEAVAKSKTAAAFGGDRRIREDAMRPLEEILKILAALEAVLSTQDLTVTGQQALILAAFKTMFSKK